MTSSNANTIVREYLIQNDMGIHSRPAAAFVKVANKYKSDVSVVYGDKWADGKSILGLLIILDCATDFSWISGMFVPFIQDKILHLG